MAAGSKRRRTASPQARRASLAPQRTSAEQLDLVTRAINEGVYDWDIARGTIYYSEAVYTVLHMPRSVITPQGWHRRIHPDDRREYDRRLVEHFKGRRDRFECDYRYRDRHGAWRWARQHGVAVRDARGRVLRLVGSTGDITEVKRVERALKESQDRYALATQAATEGIYEWNLATGSLYLSERAKEFFAVRGKALTPAAWNRRVHKEDFAGYRAALVAFFKNREAKYFEHEYRIRDAAGGYAWILDRAVAERDGRNRVRRLIGAVGDVTERKQHELELARARDEANEALERQTATAEILTVMARSPTDVQPVLDAIVKSCQRLFQGRAVAFCRPRGDMIETVAFSDDGTVGKRTGGFLKPFPLDRKSGAGACILDRRLIHVADTEAGAKKYPRMKDLALALGFHSALFVPLVRDSAALGMIGILRSQKGEFAEREVQLASTFANQAVIAIENVRLFNETKEALERQTATAEILKVIASSPDNIQPVFDAIVRTAKRLIGAFSATVTQVGGGMLHLVAHTATTPEGAAALYRFFPIPVEGTDMGRAVRLRRPEFVDDFETGPDIKAADRELARSRGFRSVVFVPLMRGGVAIGSLNVTRREAGRMSDHQVGLLKTFADQAVIAIENVRLFNETKEALERQTATAEVLKVIASSPADVQPVFNAILRSAVNLCGAEIAAVFPYDGELVRLGATHNWSEEALHYFSTVYPSPPSPALISGRTILSKSIVKIADAAADGHYDPSSAATGHWRRMLGVPMMREGEPLGALVVSWREPGETLQRQVDLLQTFADQAVIAIENVRLFNETKEALERQTATAGILAAMSGSMTDARPVFEAIVRSCSSLFPGSGVALRLLRDGVLHVEANVGLDAGPVPVDRGSGVGVCVLESRTVHLPDLEAAAAEFPRIRQLGLKYGYHSGIYAPLLRDGAAIGTIAVLRPEVGGFSEKDVALFNTFADQAVIAIENVRLFNETKEALERQTATAEILKVIASSPSDVQPVFDAIAASARRLINGRYAVVATRLADSLHLAALTGTTEEGDAALRKLFPTPITGQGAMGKAVISRNPVSVEDIQTDPAYSEAFRQGARARGMRSMLCVPMLRESEAIGVITVNRAESGPFTENQVDLLKAFADQAVIAIENVRLFNETREALAQQTATAEILKVIGGSMTDTRPVFEAIVKNCHNLFGDSRVVLRLVVGDQLHPQASVGSSGGILQIDRASASGACVTDARTIHLPDLEAAAAQYPLIKQLGFKRGERSGVYAPLLRAGKAIGSISVLRSTLGAFSEKEVALLNTFADQAVIAIENVRLFNETKEALEQQTATAEILQVISSSPTDTQPVFEAIVQAGLRLFPDSAVLLGIPRGGKVRAAAIANADAAAGALMKSRFPIPLSRDWMHAAAILDAEFIDIPDAEAEQEGRYAAGVKNFLASGYRAVTIAPMICGDAAIGAISVSRPKAGPLTEKQIALLRTFAAQAVIAIENVRVFKELEARTGALTRSVEQLTALGEVGQAISSTLDVETVLKTIVQRAVQLTGLDGGSIYEYDEKSEEFHLRAAENLSDEVVRVLRETPAHRNEGVIGRAVETGEPVEIAEMLDDSYQSPRRDTLIQAGYRALLVVPLRREEHIIGALAVNRKAPGHFSHDVVELLKTFATQSAMAIQNARLFREIAEKGKQLEVASRHKSDFLASMSHELRTPLNAILGFNEMLLGQVYGDVPADMREPLEDIQKSGKHLLRLINNVLDLAKIEAGRMELSLSDYSVHDTVESVRATLRPLAAEKGLEFLVTVPPELPLAYGDSGRITQCLMNLAGNSLKFTKAGKVEIAVAEQGELLTFRVADTGIGIPPDKIASLFTEFKQTDATIASEYGGTGLGLSISKKFVEMHGGRIWIESELGKGSTFIFEVPLRVKTP